MADDPDDPILTVNDYWPPCCPPGLRDFFDRNAAQVGVDFRGFLAKGVRASAVLSVGTAEADAATRAAIVKHKLRTARNA